MTELTYEDVLEILSENKYYPRDRSSKSADEVFDLIQDEHEDFE